MGLRSGEPSYFGRTDAGVANVYFRGQEMNMGWGCSKGLFKVSGCFWSLHSFGHGLFPSLSTRVTCVVGKMFRRLSDLMLKPKHELTTSMYTIDDQKMVYAPDVQWCINIEKKF